MHKINKNYRKRILDRLVVMIALTVQIRTLGPGGPISPRSPLGPGSPCNNVTNFKNVT